jgi:hypothetical protein
MHFINRLGCYRRIDVDAFIEKRTKNLNGDRD